MRNLVKVAIISATLAVAPLSAWATEPCLKGRYVGVGSLNGEAVHFTLDFEPFDYNVGTVSYQNNLGYSGTASYVADTTTRVLKITIDVATQLQAHLVLYHGPLAHGVLFFGHGISGTALREDYEEPEVK